MNVAVAVAVGVGVGVGVSVAVAVGIGVNVAVAVGVAIGVAVAVAVAIGLGVGRGLGAAERLPSPIRPHAPAAKHAITMSRLIPKKKGLAVIDLLRKRREQVPEILDFFRLLALQKLSSRLEIACNVIKTHEHAGDLKEP